MSAPMIEVERLKDQVLKSIAAEYEASRSLDAHRMLLRNEVSLRKKAGAALGAYARLLVRAGVLRGNSGIGGQTMTGWACAVCGLDQVSPSTAHGVLCDDCRAEVIARAALPAPAEEKRGYAPTDAIGDARAEAAEPARHYKLLPEEAAKCRCENCIKDYPDLAFHCLCPAGLHMPACACECHEEGEP